MVFALLCFVAVIQWLIFPYPSGLLHWHCGNLTIAPVPAKQPWWIWINTSCEFSMNDCITTTKQSTTKPCAYFLGNTVVHCKWGLNIWSPFYHHRLGASCYRWPCYKRTRWYQTLGLAQNNELLKTTHCNLSHLITTKHTGHLEIWLSS